MRRHSISPRAGWQASVARTGLTCHTLPDGARYWDESAYWEFTAAEIERLEEATAELHGLALAAAEHILAQDRLAEMRIPAEAAARIREAWSSKPPSLYGRLDLAYDGQQIKLLEYNADTPGALVEAAVTQRSWLEECFPKADQFNTLHDRLVARWKELLPDLKQPVYFCHDGSERDLMTIGYLRRAAEQAGHRTVPSSIESMGWEDATARFIDLERRPIESLFKLCPWSRLLRENFGHHILQSFCGATWMEPVWKVILTNRALLAILWELNPNHELLLPAYLDGPREMTDYVRKPLFGPKGEDFMVFRNWPAEEGTGRAPLTNPENLVYQKLASMASDGRNTAALGSWLIDGRPAGIGIRECTGLVSPNTSRFVPHLYR